MKHGLMKKQQQRVSLSLRQRVSLSLLSALPLAIVLAGCTSNNTFGKVNGQSITQDEYIKALERQMVSAGPNQNVPAERYVIDYLVGNKVLLAEAGKLNAMPTEQDISSYFNTQKRLFEENNMGKKYEEEVIKTGSTMDEVKDEIKMQLAEANIYARKTNLEDKAIMEAYDKLKAAKRAGLPKRAKLRLIAVADKSPDFNAVVKGLSEKKSLEDLAKLYNPQQLKATAGLLPQAQPIEQFPPEIQAKINSTADGSFFGPIVLPGLPPGQKAWVGVVEKRAELNLSLEDMRSILRRQIVQERIMQEQQQMQSGMPAGDFMKVRAEIMKQKLDAKFEPNNAAYASVWQDVVKQANDNHLGEVPKPAALPPGNPAMGAPVPAGAPPVGAPPAMGKPLAPAMGKPK
jgi:SurA N-terminal domain